MFCGDLIEHIGLKVDGFLTFALFKVSESLKVGNSIGPRTEAADISEFVPFFPEDDIGFL